MEVKFVETHLIEYRPAPSEYITVLSDRVGGLFRYQFSANFKGKIRIIIEICHEE